MSDSTLAPGGSGAEGPAQLFLSYAREDDEPFVARLYAELVDRGFTVWWDRRSMPNRGLTFLREIRDAISGSQRLVFVLGPAALRSDYVRAEWQHACGTGTPVVTILRAGDYADIPDALAHQDVLDFRADANHAARLLTLLRQLQEPVAPLGRLVGIPDLPGQFQPRPADLRALCSALLRDSRDPVVLTAAGRRAGLQGMGGIGKSVIAAAAARDFDVRRAFPDGLLWIALGQDPNLPVRQATLCRVLGDPSQVFADWEQGRARIAELLVERACLLILDDVWHTDHLRAFDGLGDRCALLVTTRDERLLDAAGATKIRLDVLAPPEAMRWMAAWIRAPEAVVPADPHAQAAALEALAAGLGDEAKLVASECGYLPLALALSAAQVRDGVSWTSVLEALRDADLEYLDHPHGSVFKSIKTSVDALDRENPAFERYYRELAVFPGGTPVPEAAVRTLWQRAGALAERTTDKLIAILARRALLRTGGAAPRRWIQLHDLQHDFVRSVSGSLEDLNAVLIDSYHAKCSAGWHTGPDDGYFFQHLTRHLAAAKRHADLHEMLTASPAWMDAQFAACNGDSQYAQDLELTLQATAGHNPVADVALRTAQQVILRRATAYSDPDLETLVRLGRTAEALSQARLRPAIVERISGLACIRRALDSHSALRDELLDEAAGLAHYLEKQSVWGGSGTLTLFAIDLFDGKRDADAMAVSGMLNRNFEQSPYGRNDLVEALVQRGRLADAAAVARDIRTEQFRVQELLAVARTMQERGEVDAARALAVEVVSDTEAAPEEQPNTFGSMTYWRDTALQDAAEILGPAHPRFDPLWARALKLILSRAAIGPGGGVSDFYRNEGLLSYAPRLARHGRIETVMRAVDWLSTQQRDEARVRIVSVAMSAAQLDTALAVAGSIDEPALRAQACTDLLAPVGAAGDDRFESILTRALNSIDLIGPATQAGRLSPYGSVRVQTICKLADVLHRLQDSRALTLRERAASDARIPDPGGAGIAEAVAAVALSMVRTGLSEEAAPLFTEALNLAGEGSGSPYNLAYMLAGHGDIDRTFAALSMLARGEHAGSRSSVLEELANQLSAGAARKVLDAIDDPASRALALAETAASRTDRDPADAGRMFQDAMADCSWALGFILSKLASSPRCWTPEILDQAFTLLPRVDDSAKRLGILQEFLSSLPARGIEGECQQLIDAAARLGSLASLNEDLGKTSGTAADRCDFGISLLLARAISDAQLRSSRLAATAVAMAHAGEMRGLAVARDAHGTHRLRALETIALEWARRGDPDAGRILDEKLLQERAETDSSSRDAAIREVVKGLARLGDTRGAVSAMAAIADESARVDALGDVAAAISGSGLLARAVDSVDSITHPLVRARALMHLAVAAHDGGLLERALGEADSSTHETGDERHHRDWIGAMCGTVGLYAREQAHIAAAVLDAARTACARMSPGGHRSQQQALIARTLADIGWFDEALEAARVVEMAGDNDFGTLRGNTLGWVAARLAHAGRAETARSAAVEADRAIADSVYAILSIAPMMPPEGFDSATSRQVAQILAERDTPGATGQAANAPGASPDQRPPTTQANPLPVDSGMEHHLAGLALAAPSLELEIPGAALPMLKEAARIAGWASPAWKMVSESIHPAGS